MSGSSKIMEKAQSMLGVNADKLENDRKKGKCFSRGAQKGQHCQPPGGYSSQFKETDSLG